MNKLWYQYEYEDEFRDDYETHEINRVLYTDKKGLEALTAELKKYTEKEYGRYKFEIEGVDEDYEAPFDFVELTDIPPDEKEREENGMGMFYVAFGSIVVVIMLAIVGLISTIRWVFF